MLNKNVYKKQIKTKKSCYFRLRNVHCVKSVHIRSFSGLYFRAFGLNTVSLRIQYLSVFSPNARKSGSEKL